MRPHFIEEWSNLFSGSREDEPAVVEPETNPQIVHEHRKSGHHSSDAPWPAEFPPQEQLELEGTSRLTTRVTYLV